MYTNTQKSNIHPTTLKSIRPAYYHEPNGVPVFKPTIEQFSDFYQFILAIQEFNTAGCIKVIPPRKWVKENVMCKHALNKISIVDPLIQTFSKVTSHPGAYILHQELNNNQSSYTFKQWQHQINLTHPLKETSTTQISNAQKSFDYTQGYHLSSLEHQYWNKLTSNATIYGAGIPGSLFPSNPKNTWNISKLQNYLTKVKKEFPGINTPFLYFGRFKSTFPWHLEDLDLYSIKHKYCVVSPEILKEHGIPVHKVIHHENEFIITFPEAYHQGFNFGINVAESVNFGTDSWAKQGKKASYCQCSPNNISPSQIFIDSHLERTATAVGIVHHRKSGKTFEPKIGKIQPSAGFYYEFFDLSKDIVPLVQSKSPRRIKGGKRLTKRKSNVSQDDRHFISDDVSTNTEKGNLGDINSSTFFNTFPDLTLSLDFDQNISKQEHSIRECQRVLEKHSTLSKADLPHSAPEHTIPNIEDVLNQPVEFDHKNDDVNDPHFANEMFQTIDDENDFEISIEDDLKECLPDNNEDETFGLDISIEDDLHSQIDEHPDIYGKSNLLENISTSNDLIDINIQKDTFPSSSKDSTRISPKHNELALRISNSMSSYISIEKSITDAEKSFNKCLKNIKLDKVLLVELENSVSLKRKILPNSGPNKKRHKSDKLPVYEKKVKSKESLVNNRRSLKRKSDSFEKSDTDQSIPLRRSKRKLNANEPLGSSTSNTAVVVNPLDKPSVTHVTHKRKQQFTPSKDIPIQKRISVQSSSTNSASDISNWAGITVKPPSSFE
ncbi:hypothetical protein HDV02_004790 [Globomyces sp. JEL0801]|nr:hypothetical protein HDV02_004790 [Globomyces sp. JEL0801]